MGNVEWPVEGGQKKVLVLSLGTKAVPHVGTEREALVSIPQPTLAQVYSSQWYNNHIIFKILELKPPFFFLRLKALQSLDNLLLPPLLLLPLSCCLPRWTTLSFWGFLQNFPKI